MIILGILAIVGAFSLFGYGDVFYGLAWAAIGSGLIAWGIHRNKQKQYQAQQQTVVVNNYTIPAGGQVVRNVTPVSNYTTVRHTGTRRLAFPVAGVTFDNEDGSSRQRILRQLCEGDAVGVAEVWFDDYLYEGRPAIHVMTPSGCVGNIRSQDVETVSSYFGKQVDKIYLEMNNFENDEGEKIYRADVVICEKTGNALPES